MKTILLAAIILAVCGLAVSCEVRVWGECRADHSWYYCMRVLNK